MLSYPVRVKVLCLISRIEPLFRWRTHWIRRGWVSLKEDLTTKGGQQYMLLVPICWASVPFPQMLGAVVSRGSQLPFGQSIDFGGMGAALLRRPCFLCSLTPGAVRGYWLTNTGYKGLAALPQVHGATDSPRHCSSPAETTFLLRFLSLPYRASLLPKALPC